MTMMTSTHSNVSSRRLSAAGLGAFLLCVGLLLVASSSARAALQFAQASVSIDDPSLLDKAGKPLLNPDDTFVAPPFSRQAGAHPDLSLDFQFPVDNDNTPLEAVRDFDVDLPNGFVGNPTAVPQCPPDLLVNNVSRGSDCPMATQVGYAELNLRVVNGNLNPQKVAVFNLTPRPDEPARFGFNYSGVVGLIQTQVRIGDRPGDYTVSSGSFSISQATGVQGARVVLWGAPAAANHDATRQDHEISMGGPFGGPGRAYVVEGILRKLGTTPRPFLTSPTSCAVDPVSFKFRADSWENPGVWDERTLSEDPNGVPLAFEGCERLGFEPSATVRPLAHAADTPTGLDVQIDVPQNEDADGFATSHVRDVKMTFPKGLTVNASSAAGLGACAPDQIALLSIAAPTCPASSKVGTVTIDTPLLEDDLEGDVILAKQNDNPFGSLLALYISVKGPGFYLKLPGKIETDPETGQLTATFKDNPQLPFNSLHLRLNGGPLAALSLPRACGTYAVESEFTPWSGQAPVTSTSSFEVNEGCNTGGFSPGLQAGTVDPTGGAYSPFVLRVTRNDGEADLASLRATLPEGLLAKLAGVQLCGDAQAASGDCPAGSQVGTVTVGAGSGSNPIYVPEPGKAPTAAYLAGPYKGAPYSMVVKVPAQAGPFDLGTVAVRNALNIDPTSAQVTAVSDPLPQILQGIPIAYRDVRVEVNRPDFTINPTSCKAMEVTSTLTSATGQTATPSAGFQASGCGELGFGPSLRLSLKGKMNRTGNPAVKAVLRAPKGEANIAKTTVTLPKSEFIDNAHISNPCTRVQFNAGECPKGSILGTATAYTPLLDKPVSGPVYFRSNGGDRELPDLVADLGGQIHVTLVGFIDTAKSGGVRTRFANVPDAPVSKFVLKLAGGKRGLIENSRDLCSFTPKAKVQMIGQNGKAATSNLKLDTSCGKAQRKR
jgi:hypothetical protein